MAQTIKLLHDDGSLYMHQLGEPASFHLPNRELKSRVVFSAAHVVCDPYADIDPLSHAPIDWEATLEYRHYLWSLGLSVAEAMDTAQRGMGLGWDKAQELMKRSLKEARSVNGQIACGAGTDHLEPHLNVSLEDVEAAYEEQCSFIEGNGGQIIMMASRALAACANGPEDYERIYRNILGQVSSPVILHWLGDMFDPALKGYWGFNDVDEAMEVCLRIIRENSDKVDGIKISLLDEQKEVEMRRRLPEHVRMYTGDDFNYTSLIRGDDQGYSHALLGIFDAIAPAAAAAIHALDEGKMNQYEAIFEKTVPLSRHIFQKPTFSYKTGIVFMAYLNGHQSHFRMIRGAESARSVLHLTKLFVLADQAGLLRDPELASKRMNHVLHLAGVK